METKVNGTIELHHKYLLRQVLPYQNKVVLTAFTEHPTQKLLDLMDGICEYEIIEINR